MGTWALASPPPKSQTRTLTFGSQRVGWEVGRLFIAWTFYRGRSLILGEGAWEGFGRLGREDGPGSTLLWMTWQEPEDRQDDFLGGESALIRSSSTSAERPGGGEIIRSQGEKWLPLRRVLNPRRSPRRSWPLCFPAGGGERRGRDGAATPRAVSTARRAPILSSPSSRETAQRASPGEGPALQAA